MELLAAKWALGWVLSLASRTFPDLGEPPESDPFQEYQAAEAVEGTCFGFHITLQTWFQEQQKGHHTLHSNIPITPINTYTIVHSS